MMMKRIFIGFFALFSLSASTVTILARSAPCPVCEKISVNSFEKVEDYWKIENCIHGYDGKKDKVNYQVKNRISQCSNCGTIISRTLISKTEISRVHIK